MNTPTADAIAQAFREYERQDYSDCYASQFISDVLGYAEAIDASRAKRDGDEVLGVMEAMLHEGVPQHMADQVVKLIGHGKNDDGEAQQPKRVRHSCEIDMLSDCPGCEAEAQHPQRLEGGGWTSVPRVITPEREYAADQRDDDEPLSDWGKSKNASRQAIWTAMLAAAPVPPAVGKSLLRPANTPLPAGCYCKPGKCMAPVVMGRQTACRDPEKAANTIPLSLDMDGAPKNGDMAESLARRVREALGNANDPDVPVCELVRSLSAAPIAVDVFRQLAERAVPFLRDEGYKYEDDGSNEPLDLAREIEAALSVSQEQHATVAAGEDAKDAARYRWLRISATISWNGWITYENLMATDAEREEMDRAIDASIDNDRQAEGV